jgi:hypothetical protein
MEIARSIFPAQERVSFESVPTTTSKVICRDAYHSKVGRQGDWYDIRTVPKGVPLRRTKIRTSTGCVPFQSLYHYIGAYKGPVRTVVHYGKCIIRTITESLPVQKVKRSPFGLHHSYWSVHAPPRQEITPARTEAPAVRLEQLEHLYLTSSIIPAEIRTRRFSIFYRMTAQQICWWVWKRPSSKCPKPSPEQSTPDITRWTCRYWQYARNLHLAKACR